MLKKFFAGFGLTVLMAAPVFAAAEAAPPTGPAPEDVAAEAPAPVVKKAKRAPSMGDEAGVKAAFDRFSKAWAAGDAKGRADCFTYDATLINPFGLAANGKEEIQKVFEQENATIAKGTTHVFSNFKIHFVMPNFALVDVDGTVSGIKTPAGADAPDVKLHAYCVVVKRTKVWQVYAARPAIYAPVPGSAPAAAAIPEISAPPVPDASLPVEKLEPKTDKK